jgi:hypothetical protein
MRNHNPQHLEHSATYQEVRIGRTVYCVTSVFNGEKELGPTLEKLAAQRVIDEMDGETAETLSID